jgi:hypothetical protein
MNLGIIILGAGALFLIVTTMGRNGRSADEPFDEDQPFYEDETGFLPGERIAPPIAFRPAPRVPSIPLYEGVDPEFFGE